MYREASGARRSWVALSWLDEHVPDGSVLVGTRRLFEQIHFRPDWKLADADVLLGRERGRRMGRGSRMGAGIPRGLGAAAGFSPGGAPDPGPGPEEPFPDGPGGGGRGFGRDPDQPSPMQLGKTDRLRARYADMNRSERAAAAFGDLLTWAGDRPIYWVGRMTDLEDLRGRLDDPPVFERVGEIEIPRLSEAERDQAEAAASRRRGPGGPGGPPGMGGGRGRRPPVNRFSLRPGTKFRVYRMRRETPAVKPARPVPAGSEERP